MGVSHVEFVDGVYRRLFSGGFVEELVAWGACQGAWRVEGSVRRLCSPSWFVLGRLARSSQCVEDGRAARLTEKEVARAVAARQLLETIPVHVRLVVSAFPEMNFELLRFVQEGGSETLRLFRENPGLVFVAAARGLLAPDAALTTEVILTRKRTTILGLAGLPEREEFLRVLSRIPASSLRVTRVLEVASTYRNADGLVLDRLRHLPRLNAGALAIIGSDVNQHVEWGLLKEVGGDHRVNEYPGSANRLRNSP